MIWFYRDCEIEWQLKIKSKQGRLCAHNKKETLLIAKHTHSAIGKPTRLKQMKEIRLQHPAELGKWKAGCMLWSRRQIKRAGLNTLPEALQGEVFLWELSWEDGVEAIFQQVQVYLWVKKQEINHYIKRSGDAKLRCESEKAQQLVKAGGTTSERITQRKSTKKKTVDRTKVIIPIGAEIYFSPSSSVSLGCFSHDLSSSQNKELPSSAILTRLHRLKDDQR